MKTIFFINSRFLCIPFHLLISCKLFPTEQIAQGQDLPKPWTYWLFFSLCDIYSIPYLLTLYLYDGFLGGQGWAAEVVVGMLSFSRVLVVFVGAADFSLGCSLRGSWLPGETTSISNKKVLWHQLCISSICRFILTLCPKV